MDKTEDKAQAHSDALDALDADLVQRLELPQAEDARNALQALRELRRAGRAPRSRTGVGLLVGGLLAAAFLGMTSNSEHRHAARSAGVTVLQTCMEHHEPSTCFLAARGEVDPKAAARAALHVLDGVTRSALEVLARDHGYTDAETNHPDPGSDLPWSER